MIITEQKEYKDILKSLEGAEKVYVIGCGRCSTSCETGGEKQVNEMVAQLKKDGKVIILII